MIKEFVEKWYLNKEATRAYFATVHPEAYIDIVKQVIIAITDDEYESPDPERIHLIDDGNYQGTLLFIIAAKYYQPDVYWYVKVDYGSCSRCDTLEAIRDYGDEPLTEEQLDDYMTLALHIVQGLKRID